MKVVVTGGAGFIGSHLVDRLVEDGHHVVVIDHYAEDRQRFENAAVTVYKIGIGDAEVNEVFAKEQPDAVFHLAAQISVTVSVADPVSDAQTNIIDALRLLQVAKTSGVKRIVFSSSGGGIYAGYPVIPTPLVFDASPTSPYGIAKMLFEDYLAISGIPFVALRLANVYGPRQMPDGEAGVIAIMCDRLISGKPMTIFGDGSATRDYLYVGDVVNAFMRALVSEATGIVNIGTGVETSVNAVWKTVCNIHGMQVDAQYAPVRLGEVMRSAIDASSSARIGWKPTVTIEEGLKKTYDWFTTIS